MLSKIEKDMDNFEIRIIEIEGVYFVFYYDCFGKRQVEHFNLVMEAWDFANLAIVNNPYYVNRRVGC